MGGHRLPASNGPSRPWCSPVIKMSKTIKLIQDYQATVVVPDLYQNCGMKKIIPFKNGRAVVIGWGTHGLGTPGYGSVNYWVAEVRPEGVSFRVLPFIESDTRNGSSYPLALVAPAFKLGEKFGVLVDAGYVLIFSGIHDDPVQISIENHSEIIDGALTPTYCGHGVGNLVPTIFAGSINDRFGRHVCLLEIDQDAMTAKWLGRPLAAAASQYIPFDTVTMPGSGGGFHIDGEDEPPLFYDCSRVDDGWHLYAPAYSTLYPRHGTPLGVLTKNNDDLTVSELVFRQKDQSLGRICASLDRMIVSPFGKMFSHKGKQTIFMLQDRVELPLTLPRGNSKYCVQEFYDGHYWLTPDSLSYNREPYIVMACKARPD